jgi:hypothetical protein
MPQGELPVVGTGYSVKETWVEPTRATASNISAAHQQQRILFRVRMCGFILSDFFVASY